MTPDLTVVILTYNESIHLERAIRSVAAIAKHIIVVDSFSTDDTADIARRLGATVVQHAFVNYAKQFQWALDTGPITTDWIMRIDADEIVSEDLADEIRSKLGSIPAGVAGINLKRKHIFMGRWIRHGGRYPLPMTRLWRRGQGRIEDRWMDEHMLVKDGATITFEGGFADHNLKGLGFFVEKHNGYATREAIDILLRKYRLSGDGPATDAFEVPAGTRMTAMLKERLYNRLPFPVSSTLYFVYRYVFRLGFLDGVEGLIYHSLQGFWYRFLVGAKAFELRRAIAGMDDPAKIKTELSRLTGHQID